MGFKLEAKRLPKRLQKGFKTALRGFLAPRGSQKDSKTSLGVPKLSKNVPKSSKIDPKSCKINRKMDRKKERETRSTNTPTHEATTHDFIRDLARRFGTVAAWRAQRTGYEKKWSKIDPKTEKIDHRTEENS